MGGKVKAGGLAALLLADLCLCAGSAAAMSYNQDVKYGHHLNQAAMTAVRSRFFGAENVDPYTGDVDPKKVIFAWVTNATLAVAVKGRVILLDTYINRVEVSPKQSAPDLRRSPIDVDDLVQLNPEAIFLGHGHFDHADNAAYVAKWLDIPIYSSPETCDVMQLDVARMAADPNTVNGGKKLVPNAKPVKCVGIVPRGSVPGTAIVNIKQLEPIACIIAFKHIHSTSNPTDPNFPFFPVNADSDPREADIYPQGTCLTPTVPPTGLQTCHGNGTPVPPVKGQEDLSTTAGGNPPGNTAGAISLFYSFVLRGDNNFTFVWHNTTGALKEGTGTDPGLPSPAVGAHLFQIMDSLPQTNVEFGSIVSLGWPTNGTRDEILYQSHLKPQVYVPIHMTDATPLSSSLRYKKSYIQTIVASGLPQPEARWMVDPDDYLKPMVFDPKSDRWDIDGRKSRVRKFCQ